MATKTGITRKTSATKYKQGRNLTFYFNSVKRAGAEKREDAFLMVDSEELITLADALHEEHDMEPKEIAVILLGLIIDEGNINMTFGNEVKKSADSTGKFNAAAILASLGK